MFFVAVGLAGIGQRAANFSQQKADWILVLGARLDLPSVAFNHGNFAPNARKYIVDLDAAELAKLKMSGAKKINADLIMIMTQDREIKWTEKFIGSAAQEVINNTDVPVLTIHPEKMPAGITLAPFSY